MVFLRWRRMARRLAPLIVAALWLAASVAGEPPSLAPHSEYEIESAMLYNFTKFIEWPEHALGAPGAPLTACVWADDSMATALEAALRNKSIHGHPVAVRRLLPGGDPSGCAVLFLGGTDRKQMARMVRAVERSPVLTVSDQSLFARQGGVVAFLHDGNRIRFEINLDAAERAGLQMSSQLLQLAAIWREKPPGTEMR